VQGRRHYGRWALALLALLVLAAAAFLFWPGPDLTRFRSGPPPELWATAARQQALWKEQGSSRTVRFSYVPLERVADHLLVAILVSEDINFFQHKGIDFRAWPEAFRQWREGRRLRGASTLSQQLAKNLFLSPRRSLWRKLQELRLALRLERELGKRRILELYVNIVEFGPGLYGAEAAARSYFGCSAAALDPDQAASLAAAIPAPSQDNPKTASARFSARKEVIARRAAKASWLYPLVRQIKSSPP
jgi:monofunctional biosynthetic peptidoglycan transglycosylase